MLLLLRQQADDLQRVLGVFRRDAIKSLHQDVDALAVPRMPEEQAVFGRALSRPVVPERHKVVKRDESFAMLQSTKGVELLRIQELHPVRAVHNERQRPMHIPEFEAIEEPPSMIDAPVLRGAEISVYLDDEPRARQPAQNQ